MSAHSEEKTFTRIWCERVNFNDTKLPVGKWRVLGSLTVIAYYGNSWLIFSASVRAHPTDSDEEIDRELTVQEMPLHDALRFVVDQAEVWKNRAGELLGGKK